MKIAFTKMQGLGNDFILINGISEVFSFSESQIRSWSDRHYGIGFDQLLLIEKPRTPHTAFFYRIFNADGQEVEQCGNGARCVAKYAYMRKLVLNSQFKIETNVGILDLKIEQDGNVTVNMGYPEWRPALIPFLRTDSQPKLSYSLDLNSNTVEIGAVSMGNPHCVLRVADLTHAPIETIGMAIAQHSDFPQGVNVGFMQIFSPTHIGLRVLERGVGETLACGSGACAAVAIGRLQGELAETVSVTLPGGNLKITSKDKSSPVLMTGPAVEVFEGEIQL